MKRELVLIRLGNVLLRLNEPNSRCYREMMKWKYSEMLFVCYTLDYRDYQIGFSFPFLKQTHSMPF